MNSSTDQPLLEPIAILLGKPLHEAPKDLYIPPQALEIFLETFTGPLDLLLYLVKKSSLDILDISITKITEQYLAYIEMMQHLQLELAAEYLVMAAVLAELKSRLLLPKPPKTDPEEADPRAELIRKLQEYERYKKAAQDLDTLPRMQRDTFPVQVALTTITWQEQPRPALLLTELVAAFQEVLTRAERYLTHQIRREPLSVRERMTMVLARLAQESFVEFSLMFTQQEGRAGIVTTFMAILELLRQNLIEIIQTETYGTIYLKHPITQHAP